MKFSVVLKHPDGSETREVIEAPNRLSVYGVAERGNATVVSLEERSATGGMPSWASMTIGSGVKTEVKITFTKNLAAMLGAGLALSRALSVLERQTPQPAMKKIIIAIENAVKSGAAFHEALAVHPKVFPRLFVAMTKAGEEGGTLTDTLKILAKQMEASHNLTKKIRGAMIYPCIILSAIFIIGILMMIFVVPTLSSTFASLGAELPRSTRIIIGLSNFIIHNLIVTIGIIIVAVIGLIAFLRSRPGGRLVLAGALHMPVIKMLVQETYSARATRTLSSLLSSGVEMLTAIGISAEVVGDNRFGAVLIEAGERVRKGDSLSQIIEAYPKLYPVFVSEMVSVGEETGKLADMLGQVAQYYEDDVQERTKDLSTIIEPLLMLFIGAFVGVFAISMISPIYSLSNQI